MDRSSREGAKTRRARHGSGYSFTTYSSYTSDSAGHDYSIYTEEGAGTVGTYTDHSDGWSSSYFYGVRWDGGVDSDSSYDSYVTDDSGPVDLDSAAYGSKHARSSNQRLESRLRAWGQI